MMKVETALLPLMLERILRLCLRHRTGNVMVLEQKFRNQACLLRTPMYTPITGTHDTDALHQTSGSQELEEIQYSDPCPREWRGATPAFVDGSLLAASF